MFHLLYHSTFKQHEISVYFIVVDFNISFCVPVPPNGLVIYCGTIVTEEGKEKKVNIDFEPFKPINTSLYLCDNKFHTEALTALLADDNKFGFIVMDGNGALFGTLQVKKALSTLFAESKILKL